jgi:SAM-dependent methyltransferase
MLCSVCGCKQFVDNKVLWETLVTAWQLSPSEENYLNRQQGTVCTQCGSNLRSIALSQAILSFFGSDDLFVNLVEQSDLKNRRVLEVNAAGTLTTLLAKLGDYTFAEYPQIDIHNLPFPDSHFDLVVHSDTLEHVQNPIRALKECYRVLKPGGALCYTVPIVVGRMSRNRSGLARSFHGNSGSNPDDFLVHTEFGADAWTFAFEAGFTNLQMHCVDYPSAIAISCVRQMELS